MENVRLLSFSLLALFLPQMAVGANSFVWQLSASDKGSVVECSRVQIIIETNTSVTTPFTMFAYEAEGLTTVQTLDSDVDNLFWTVDHAADSQLVLAMIDANGTSGGVSGQVINVQAGTNSSCLPGNLASPVSLTTNTTKNLETCSILPLKISGGLSPYTISVVALGAAAVENVTLSPGFDAFNWVNRASPNTKLLGSISDSNGSYATSTNLLTTFGSTNLTCDNLFSEQYDSSLGSSSVLVSATETLYAVPSDLGLVIDTSAQGNTNSINRNITVGATVGGVVLFIGLLAGGFFYYKQRKRAGAFSRLLNDELDPFVVPQNEEPYRDSHMAQANLGSGSNGLGNNLQLASLDGKAPKAFSRNGQNSQTGSSAEHVYQHEDLEDIVGGGSVLPLELPPAYRDRMGADNDN